MRLFQIGLGLLALPILFDIAASEENRTRVDPPSSRGLASYAQGGVVVDGVAYFAATDRNKRNGAAKAEDFPAVVAFDVRTLKRLGTYKFSYLYDSSPLVFQTKDGTWLVIAHEHKRARTVAIHRDTGKVRWISATNQPGTMFFGYSWFKLPDGSKLILAACTDGLHAMSGETGEEAWWLKCRSSGGVTPSVDQRNGWIFYQCNGQVLKVRAADGEVLKSVSVDRPTTCVSWNTLLVNDRHGYFVATYWYGANEWDGAIRAFDKNLNPVWEKTGLPIGKKATLTYANGKLVSGSGNQWHAKYKGDKWKYIAAYAIGSGRVVWKCDLSKHEYTCILNVPYYNGYFYAETQDGPRAATSKLFRINAADGKLEEVLDYGRKISSCAPSIIARGRIFSGDLHEDRVVVTKIAENSKADWPGPFGDPQTNQMALPGEPNAQAVPMRELGRSNPQLTKEQSP